MIIEYAREAIDQVREALAGQLQPMGPRRFAELPPKPLRYCPRHGDRYVVRRGTNRCPKGRKREVNCA